VGLRGLFARLGVHRREHVSVARDFSFSGLNSVSLVLLLSTALVLRRYLGPYLTGIWTGLELLPTYVGTYGHFGVLTAAERELPFLVGARRTEDFERLKHTLFWFTHASGLLLAALLAARRQRSEMAAAAPVFCCMVMLSPLAWKGHFVALILPAAYLAARAISATPGLNRRVARLAIAVTFALFTLTSPTLVGARAAEWADDHSLVLLGALITYLAVLF